MKKLFILQKTEDDVDISGYKKEIETTFLKLQDVAKKIDGSLINTVGAELQKTLQNMDAIQKKLIKSVKQKNETELLQIEKIKNQSGTSGIDAQLESKIINRIQAANNPFIKLVDTKTSSAIKYPDARLYVEIPKFVYNRGQNKEEEKRG